MKQGSGPCFGELKAAKQGFGPCLEELKLRKDWLGPSVGELSAVKDGSGPCCEGWAREEGPPAFRDVPNLFSATLRASR